MYLYITFMINFIIMWEKESDKNDIKNDLKLVDA